ncbi:condensation domain-containing protein [Streptomyces sp. G5(2025)]|uniref:condensation domain-containing protein n=1 Tax=Streptomyces sp. G5(2025) TaxID=3406628 RepID=UPI003C247472
MQQAILNRGPATFGQLSLWRSIQNIPSVACNLPQVWALPSGATKESVERALEVLEERHASLRTRFEDSVEHGLTQVVWTPAPAGLDVTEGEPAAVAEDLAAVPFDLAADRPWRARIVTAQGAAAWLVICFHHIAVDAWAINQLSEEFSALLAGRQLPASAPNCLDLAADQWSDTRQGRRRSARKHWQEILRSAPPMARDRAPEAVSSRWARHGSSAGAQAARRIADRLNVSAPSVLIAAFCASLARQTGEEQVLVAVYTNNRSDPRWESLVAAQNQIVPLLVTVDPAEEFDAFVTKVHWELVRSYKHGAYNVDDMLEVGRANGYAGTVNGAFEGSVSGFFRYFFNYLGEYQAGQTTPPLDMETGTGGRNIGAPLYLQVQDGDVLTCTLRENSSATGFDTVTGILHGFEDVLVASGASR